MKISKLIKKLEEIKEKEGDLRVCISQDHEYWGSLHNLLREHDIRVNDHAQPDGPKSGKSERAVILGD